MVMPFANPKHRRQGMLTTDLVVAMALLVLLVFPITYGYWEETRTARSHYQRAAVMELVDGEMEFLAAGEWPSHQTGTHPYLVHAASVTNLPPGRFLLTVEPPLLRLTWEPSGPRKGPAVSREWHLP